MVAYEQAYKANEYEANSRHNKRKSYYIFMGFSVSFSLLLQRVNTYNPSVENALIFYLVVVCIFAALSVWLLLKDVNCPVGKLPPLEQKYSKKNIFDISYTTAPDPFLSSPSMVQTGMLLSSHDNYLLQCIQSFYIHYFSLKQRLQHETMLFSYYFYSFVIASLLLLYWVEVWVVYIPIVQRLYYLVVEYLYPFFIQ